MTPAEDELGHRDIEAALATRRELGAHYDAELVEGFAERIERAVEQRVADQVALQQRRTAAIAGAGGRQTALGIISVLAGIPITAITLAVPDTGEASLMSLVVTWGGLIAVNAAHAWQSRRP